MGSGEPDRGQRARWEAEHPDRSAPDGGQRTRWEAECPMGSRVPDGKQSATRGCAPGQKCTRWGAVHLDRTGAMHTDRVSCPRQQAQTRRTAACRDTRRRCGWLDSLRCVLGAMRAWGIGADRGVCGERWLPRRAHPRAGWIVVRVGRCERGASARIAVRVGTMAAPPRPPPRRADRGACGAMRAWGIGADRGACGGDAGVGHRRGSWRSLCVSRRPRPCRCRDGCRETRAPGEPGRWPLRR